MEAFHKLVLTKNKERLNVINPRNSIDLYDIVPWNFSKVPLINVKFSEICTKSDPMRGLIKLYLLAKEDGKVRALLESESYKKAQDDFKKAKTGHSQEATQ